jgi:hypothetical protein
VGYWGRPRDPQGDPRKAEKAYGWLVTFLRSTTVKIYEAKEKETSVEPVKESPRVAALEKRIAVLEELILSLEDKKTPAKSKNKIKKLL